MSHYVCEAHLLRALVRLGQCSEHLNLFTVSEHSGLDVYRLLRAAERLDRAGLLERRRWRLTLAGLAVGVGLLAEAGQRASVEELDRVMSQAA